MKTVPASVLDGPTELLKAGSVIADRYRVDGPLGEGAMGYVLAATDLQTEARVAIKFLSSVLPRDRDQLRRFFREAHLASGLGHPNIVRVLEFGVDERAHAPFMVMDHIDGETLRALLDRERTLTLSRAAALLGQVARALGVAHANDLVHRDLKPANLMVTPRGGAEHVTEIDFGVAKSLRDEAELSRSGLVVGTPLYMSPEQATGAPVDARADLYAVGCLLYEVLTGAAPPGWLGGAAERGKLMPGPLPGVSRRLLTRLEALQRSLLALSPAGRPTEAAEVALELEGIAAAARREEALLEEDTADFELPDYEALLACSATHITERVVVAADPLPTREASATDRTRV